MERWPTLARRVIHQHPVLGLERVTRRDPWGAERDYLVLQAPDWVNVVPVTPAGQVVLVRQYRQGSQAPTLEIPGGMVDPGEDPAAAAARELKEETGYAAPTLTFLGQVNPNPALFANRCATYLAQPAEAVAPPAPDEGEDLEVVLLPPAEVMAMVADGRIDHSLVVSALCFWWLKAGQLPAGGR